MMSFEKVLKVEVKHIKQFTRIIAFFSKAKEVTVNIAMSVKNLSSLHFEEFDN